jgi:hypothetical protein
MDRNARIDDKNVDVMERMGVNIGCGKFMFIHPNIRGVDN